MAKDACNTRDPERVALVYNEDSWWRNRADYRLINELWAVTGNRIAVRFPYEWHDDSGNWYRAPGDEQWEFTVEGLMRRREANINDVPIREADRCSLALGPRPADHPGLSELGL